MARLVDGYAGFGGLVSGKIGDGARLAFCWAHVPRKFYDIHVAARSRSDAVNRPSELDIGQSLSASVEKGDAAHGRLAGMGFRQALSAPAPPTRSRDRHSLGQQPA